MAQHPTVALNLKRGNAIFFKEEVENVGIVKEELFCCVEKGTSYGF